MLTFYFLNWLGQNHNIQIDQFLKVNHKLIEELTHT
jgi:hypothetical protein